MNQIESKVRSAHRRIVLGRIGQALCVTLFVSGIIAILAIAVPQLWFIDVDFWIWTYAWIGGCILAATIAAVIYGLATAPTRQSVASEVDRRFSLRERLSSSMSLADRDRESDFGIALVSDAEQRADQLEIADRFAIRPSKLGWLPIAVVPVLAMVLLLVDPMNQSSAGNANKVDALETKQIQTVASQLKKQISQQRRKAEAENLAEAKEMYEKMEAQLDKIMKRQDLNRKDAMISMNDLKKQLDERRKQLGSSEQMRRALSQMKGIESGPGEKVAKSIAKGDFGDAKDAVKDLASKMRDGKLSDVEKEKLEKQVEKMTKALQDALKEHEQTKKDLQRQIEKARQEGRGNDAARMQQKLNQLQMKDAQMQKLGQMAEAMSQASQAMKNGDPGSAADAMEQLAEQLGEMQAEMSELEDLETAMGQLSQSKNQMRCENCGGAGCPDCQGSGFGFGDGFGEFPGRGMGRGAGAGERPEQEDETNTYESQVRGQVRRGRAIISGFADGPNRKGVTREDVKVAVEAAVTAESDPTEDQTLPRTEREHAQQYFDRLREGR